MLPIIPATVSPSRYRIERSLRFNSADSARLTRTVTTSATFTFSAWVKRAALGVISPLFGASIQFTAADALTAFGLTTTAVFRDPGAWYHVHVSNNGLYVNGVSYGAVTTSALTSPAIGFNGTQYFNGYMTEIHMADGISVAASLFGATDATAGVWSPQAYGGSYGANGFHLKFADNSNTTAATLGKDSSPNGNNWTPTSFSVTAGNGNDSLTDTPTNYGTDTGVGGECRGNFAVANPLDAATITVRNGNLEIAAATTGWNTVRTTMNLPLSGHWWAEIEVTTYSSNGLTFGIADINAPRPTYTGNTSSANSIGYQSNTGQKVINGTATALGATWGVNDRIGVRIDNGSIYFYKFVTGAWALQGGGAAATGLTGEAAISISAFGAADVIHLNTGQRPWHATLPNANAKAICTQNMAATTPVLPATFTGNANANGPVVWAKGVVQAVTINGNVATRGTHFDGLSNGIKLRTASASYNASGSNTITVGAGTTYGASIKHSRGQTNP